VGPYVWDVEAVTFCRQGTCRRYRGSTDYHPILIIVFLIDSPGVPSVEELFPVTGVFHLWGSKNHSPLEMHTAGVEVCLIKSTWPIWTVRQRWMLESKETSSAGGYPMAALCLEVMLNRGGEHQGDLADSAVCLACWFKIDLMQTRIFLSFTVCTEEFKCNFPLQMKVIQNLSPYIISN
jgi:hypothetical protein